MKRLILVACISLTACGPEPISQQAPPPPSDIEVYTDRQTGCQYLRASWGMVGSALTPRMGRDGKQVCQ